jgi:hypothetical protein
LPTGEELTTNYLHYHYHFFGLSYRGPELSSFWHFSCSCRRCRDPSEFGTMADSLICPECVEGRLLPLTLTRYANNNLIFSLSTFSLRKTALDTESRVNLS